MKTAITILIAFTLVIASGPAFGNERELDITADVVLVRPLGLVAVVLGTAAFIVALPFSVPSGSVETTARTLVAEPFKYTFARPIGEFGGKWSAGGKPVGEH